MGASSMREGMVEESCMGRRFEAWEFYEILLKTKNRINEMLEKMVEVSNKKMRIMKLNGVSIEEQIVEGGAMQVPPQKAMEGHGQ